MEYNSTGVQRISNLAFINDFRSIKSQHPSDCNLIDSTAKLAWVALRLTRSSTEPLHLVNIVSPHIIKEVAQDNDAIATYLNGNIFIPDIGSVGTIYQVHFYNSLLAHEITHDIQDRHGRKTTGTWAEIQASTVESLVYNNENRDKQYGLIDRYVLRISFVPSAKVKVRGELPATRHGSAFQRAMIERYQDGA